MNKVLIGANIKRWRQFKGIKQEHLASDLNITRSTLSRYENGKGNLAMELMLAIALKMNVTIQDIVS
jgi:transcriptional regulator with XRE-family HTH domain